MFFHIEGRSFNREAFYTLVINKAVAAAASKTIDE